MLCYYIWKEAMIVFPLSCVRVRSGTQISKTHVISTSNSSVKVSTVYDIRVVESCVRLTQCHGTIQLTGETALPRRTSKFDVTAGSESECATLYTTVEITTDNLAFSTL